MQAKTELFSESAGRLGVEVLSGRAGAAKELSGALELQPPHEATADR
jgi:trehalose-6-phosphate synthase